MYAPVSVSGPIGNRNRRLGGGGGGGNGAAKMSTVDFILRVALMGALATLMLSLGYLNYAMSTRRTGVGVEENPARRAEQERLLPRRVEGGDDGGGAEGADPSSLAGLRIRASALKEDLASMQKELRGAAGAGGARAKEPKPYRCTLQERMAQEKRLNLRFKEWWSHSACPDQVWMEKIASQKLLDVGPTAAGGAEKGGAGSYLVLDVGCNKGYTSADYMDLLSPGAKMNPDSLVKAIRAVAKEDGVKYDRDCGVCNDCKKAPNAEKSELRNVDVHCFEPSPATYGMLERVHSRLQPEKTSDGWAKWHIHNLGMHETSGNMSWHGACDTAVGDELCTIVPDGTTGSVPVGVVTVDDFLLSMNEKKSPIVHVLKIDAEGLDPAVLRGAVRTLSERRAVIVVFEFNPGLSERDHPHGMWGRGGKPRADLVEITDWLDGLSYECYLDSRVRGPKDVVAPPLYMITGGCLSKEPHVKGWANVVCASRAYPAAANALRELATLIDFDDDSA